MFHLSFSNRFEILLDTLLERLGAEQPGPFGQRQVVVPSSALRRVVELAVADREGVSANLRFDYLAQWLWQQIGRVVPVMPTNSLFDGEAQKPYSVSVQANRPAVNAEAGASMVLLVTVSHC